jgi:hypothetical protein
MVAPRSIDRIEVQRLRSQGYTPTAIARRMGHSFDAVRKVVRAAERVSPANEPPPQPPPRHTYATVEAMVAQGIPRREATRLFHKGRV